MPVKAAPVLERFWSRVNKDGPVPQFRPDLGPCWLWTGALNADGYGQFCPATGQNTFAHIFSFDLAFGRPAEGLQRDHLCRVRHCVNPAHMEAVTRKENILRGFGFSAIEARQTHCIHGHEFTPENTHFEPNGQRRCRACGRFRKATARSLSR